MSTYVEFHLGKTITLSALSDLLTEIGVARFQGFVRVSEAGEGRYVLSFPRAGSADVALVSLIRENPSRLYAEASAGYLGEWVLATYAGEISTRTGALVSTAQNRMLHPAPRVALPTFADWLLSDPQRAGFAKEAFARYAPVTPLPLRGVC
jgi:hypothetical protein